MNYCLGYLSGAPIVSTELQAELGGARTHVLGIITAFEKLGWDVKPYIVGDKVPRKWVTKGSEKVISTSLFRTLVVDLIRLIFSVMYSRKAKQEIEYINPDKYLVGLSEFKFLLKKAIAF